MDDTTTLWFCIRGACFDAITAEVFFHCKSGQSNGPDNFALKAAQLSDHARKPYAGWSRWKLATDVR
ncbi:hypothetical protein [Arthrobacter sp. NicSoilB8]|uniref:hypothetical protein n=1 Tax=Arthrobacter sp. NicSoilB8 TaxID=2830998 RepID=UPI001CC73F64|nr:hypothetical protein [Arthrobacter sp. NicSoilB8]BCW70924.1 hypothetical protein NicSoilB8_19680 [Arthrobacter sp. NicSoilB8]